MPRPVGGCRTRVIATRNPAFGRAGLHNQGERAVLNDQMLIGGIIVGAVVMIVTLVALVVSDAERYTDYNDEDYWDR